LDDTETGRKKGGLMENEPKWQEPLEWVSIGMVIATAILVVIF